jgi:hypothetical protein
VGAPFTSLSLDASLAETDRIPVPGLRIAIIIGGNLMLPYAGPPIPLCLQSTTP